MGDSTLSNGENPCAETAHQSRTEVRSLRVQLQDLQLVTGQLQTDRDGLAGELADVKDALQEADKRLSNANQSLTQLKTDTERRLRQKDDEADTIRSVTY